MRRFSLYSFGRYVLVTFFITTFLARTAYANSIIRDAEVEHTLRMFTDPIFLAADIEPGSVRLFIINNDSINAFVAGGLNIFIHTGLILNADDPGMLIGVLAHETGHIAGAHLSQLSSATEEASLGALLTYVLGAAATVAGQGDVGGAIMSAGQNTALRNLLSHYRGNEQQADQAAIRFLRTANLPPHGMLEMFELLRRNEKQHFGDGDPYLRTHPLTKDRIAVMRSAVNASRITPDTMPKEYIRWHQRMVAKLFAFLEKPEKTFARYPETDQSEAGYLARSIAWFHKPDLQKALREVDRLIEISPDAFAYDLKGQILFENGRIADSIAAYRKAHQLLPENGIILTDLASAHIATGEKPALVKAVQLLERSSRLDDSLSKTYRQLAIAYGKLDQIGKSNLALAKEAELKGKPEDTIRYAALAQKSLTAGTPAMIEAEDLITEAKRLLKEKKDSTLPF